MRFLLGAVILLFFGMRSVAAQGPVAQYRFPWPPTAAPPSVAGITLGHAAEQVYAMLGVADATVDVETARVRVILYHDGGLGIIVDSTGVISVRLQTSTAGALDSIAVGMSGLAALTRWGEPTRVERSTGAAVWVGPGWEIHAFLRPDGQTLGDLELRRPPGGAASSPRAP